MVVALLFPHPQFVLLLVSLVSTAVSSSQDEALRNLRVCHRLSVPRLTVLITETEFDGEKRKKL